MSETPPPVETEQVATEGVSRRGLLAAGFLSTLIGVMVGVPAIGYILAPLRKTEKPVSWVALGPLDQFGVNRVEREYAYSKHDAWLTTTAHRRILVGKDGNGFVAFSTECTHLGCGVRWDANERKFRCPCHGGVFGPDGSVLVPPPVHPLRRLETRVRDGMLEVREG